MKNIFVPVIAGVSVWLSQPLQAEQEEHLEHVLVTVPIHRKEAETALPVTVLSGDELHRNLAASIGETLQNKPGLSSASFGPTVGQPVIRGQQGARVTVLQNSMSAADASNISADHAVSVEPVLAESIEVLRGPSTLLYGGGAIGGVVNVIDRRIPASVPESTEGRLELRHGSANDESTAVVSIDAGSRNFAWHVDALNRVTNNLDIPGLAAAEHDDHETQEGMHDEHDEHEEEETTDGYIANTDSETNAFTLGGSYFFDKGFFGFAVSRLENQYGIPAGAHSHGHDEHEEDHNQEHEDEHADEESVRIDLKQTRYDLRADVHDVTRLIENLRWNLSYSDYQHDELEGREVGTRWQNETWESRLELLHRDMPDWHGVLGLQLKHTDFSAVGAESYIPQTDSSRYGLFLVEDTHYGEWLFELGLRVDVDEIKPSGPIDEEMFTSTSWSASALRPLGGGWRLGLALSSSERAPVVEELFSNHGNSLESYVEHVASGTIELGDSELDSEQSNNLDVTLSYARDAIDAYLTVFYNDYQDYIYLADTGLEQDETPVLQYSQQDAEFVGIEFEFEMELGHALNGIWSLAVFGDAIEGELDTAGDVPRLPPMRVGSRLSVEWQRLLASVSVLDADEQDKPGAGEEPTDAYTRWDANVEYRFGDVADVEYSAFLRLKNISDEDIRNASSFLRDVAPEAGRSIEMGVRLSF